MVAVERDKFGLCFVFKPGCKTWRMNTTFFIFSFINCGYKLPLTEMNRTGGKKSEPQRWKVLFRIFLAWTLLEICVDAAWQPLEVWLGGSARGLDIQRGCHQPSVAYYVLVPLTSSTPCHPFLAAILNLFYLPTVPSYPLPPYLCWCCSCFPNILSRHVHLLDVWSFSRTEEESTSNLH